METFTQIMKVAEYNLSEKPKEGFITRKTDIKLQPTIPYIYQMFFTKEAKKQNKHLIENFVMNLPNRSYQKYTDIEEVEDYDFSNNLVLEMLSRNKRFRKFSQFSFKYEYLVNKDNLSKLEKSFIRRYPIIKERLSKYFGFNMNYYNTLMHEMRGLHTKNFSNNEYNVNSFPRICDIKDGMERVIKYFYEKKSICDFELRQTDISLNEIMENYYEYQLITENYGIVNLNEDLPINILNDEFIKTLSEDDLINKIERVNIGSLFNDLEFVGTRLINVDLNMNLPLEELHAYINKIKEEFSKSKTPLEILKQEIENIENPKSLKLIPNDKIKKKKAYANAFYIYDLYENIYYYFHHMRKDIKKRYIEEKLEHEKITDKDERKSKIANLTEDYENELKNYNQEKIYDIMVNVSEIKIDQIKKLHKLLKEYIEDLKYKNIIFNK